MRHAFVSLLLLLFIPTLPAQGSKTMKKSFTVDGKKIDCVVESFDPPASFTRDSSQMDQKSAANCSRLFYDCLGKGDIKAAAALSNEPSNVAEKFSRHKERLGEKEFARMYAGYFSGNVLLKFTISLGPRQMLIVHDKDMEMDMAQFYVGNKGVWQVDERESAERTLLGKLFNSLKNDDGTVTIP